MDTINEKTHLKTSFEDRKVEFKTQEEEAPVEPPPKQASTSPQTTGYNFKVAVSQKLYPANKKNSSHYTGLSFIPVNLYHQLQNPVFQFYLFIMILELLPWVSLTGGVPNTLLPYSIVVLVQMLVDFLICFKVNDLDWIQNNLKVD